MRHTEYAAASWPAANIIRRAVRVGLLLVSLVVISFIAANQAPIPTISVVSVKEDQEVTIRTANFPANQSFIVTMGPMGTRGVSGYAVGTLESGAGGAIEATFVIPEALRGSRQIAIRAQTNQVNPYFSYNWFYNAPAVTTPANPTDATAGSGGVQPTAPTASSGVPTVSIGAVEVGTRVTIVTNNYPANQVFNVYMGPRGSRGIDGTFVGTLDSGAGGSMTASFEIPEGLQDAYIVAVRLQTEHSRPYYSYSWFYNNMAAAPATTPATAATGGQATAPPAGTGTGGQPAATAPAGAAFLYRIPTIAVCGVSKGDTVTINATNFPAGMTFAVTMGTMWTRGVGGTVVGNFNSGDGSALQASFTIPDALQAADRIAIRAQSSHVNPYYSYNWFYNENASGCE